MRVHELSQNGNPTSRGILNSISRRYAEYGDNPIIAARNMAVSGSGMFRNCQPLPPEAGEEMDEIVTRIGEDRRGALSLLVANVERALPNWWSVTSKQYMKVSKQGRARRTMRPGGRGERSMADRTPASVPIYATEQDFDYHDRFLQVADSSGVDIESESLENATENAFDAIEDAIINGVTTKFMNLDSFGVLNAPDANTVTYTDNRAWDHSSKTGKDILRDVLALRDANYVDKHRGPRFGLIIEPNYETPLDESFSDGVTTDHNMTVRERLLKLEWLTDIVISDQMPDDRTALIELDTKTCGIFTGQDPTWVPLGERRFQQEFLVLACMVPYFRNDHENGSGVALGNV